MLTKSRFMKLSPKERRNIARAYMFMSLSLMMFVIGMACYVGYKVLTTN